MLMYPEDWDVASVKCPACGVKSQVWCAPSMNGPMVHERRNLRWREKMGMTSVVVKVRDSSACASGCRPSQGDVCGGPRCT